MQMAKVGMEPLPIDLSSVGPELASVLSEAWDLGILPESSVETILKNLQRGDFSEGHYLNLYKDRVWRAMHPEQVAAMAEAEKEAAQQRKAEEAAALQALRTPASWRPATNDPPIMNVAIGGFDFSRTTISFALHASHLVVYRSRRFLVPLPLPRRVDKALPHGPLQPDHVQVFTRTVHVHIETRRAGQSDMTIKTERIDLGSTKAVQSGREIVYGGSQGAGWLEQCICGADEDSSYEHYFLGVQPAGAGAQSVVQLSQTFVMSKQAAACFAARDQLRRALSDTKPVPVGVALPP